MSLRERRDTTGRNGFVHESEREEGSRRGRGEGKFVGESVMKERKGVRKRMKNEESGRKGMGEREFR